MSASQRALPRHAPKSQDLDRGPVDETSPSNTMFPPQSMAQMQAGGMGMSDVRALLSGGAPDQAFDLGRMGRATTLPFQGMLRQGFGAGLGGISAFQGPMVDVALDLMGARAAEHEGDVLLPSAGVTPELVGEEAAHALQGRQNGRAGGSGQTSRPTDGAEQEARWAAEHVAKGEPVKLTEPVGAEVNRSWLGEAWDTASNAVSGAAKWAYDGVTNTASSIYHGLTDWHFEGRDALNKPQPTQEELNAADSSWKLLPKEMSVFHDNKVGDPEKKYVHPDGSEAVIDGDTGEHVTDPKYMGTYNYVNPMAWGDVNGITDVPAFLGKNVGHFFADVVPYFFGGNVRGDG